MNKIVFITNRLIGGGSERVLVTLANSFYKKGYQVSIISFQKGETYQIEKGIKVYAIGGKNSKINHIKKIRKYVHMIKPDTVISFEYFVNMQVAVSCMGMKTNLIASERNDPSQRGGGFPTRIIRNMLYGLVDCLVCQTPDAKRYFPRRIQKKTLIIPNPIKEDLPIPWKGERKKRIVNFCRIEKQKNLHLLIDSFDEIRKKYHDYELVIYGDGTEKKDIIEYIKEKNADGQIKIYPAEQDVHRLVIDSKMFVSSSDYEGLSNSMIEAMAIGLPTICTDCPVGGARMMIKNGINGILVDVGDVNGMAAAMVRLIEDSKLSNELSINGAKIRERLCVNRIVGMWEEAMKRK